jgi:ADP-ribosylglycohydrolase
MRSAIIGAYWAGDSEKLREFVDASTRATHIDPRALEGAWLVARETAGLGVADADPMWRFSTIEEMLRRGAHPREFADALGLHHGVSGFVLHTVPVAIYCARWANGNFRQAITAAAELGGDSDTLCAIVGGIVGAQVGTAGIPEEWMNGLWEWPRSVNWMRAAARALAQGEKPPATFWPAYLLRSPLFIGTVVAHGFRRTLPPF